MQAQIAALVLLAFFNNRDHRSPTRVETDFPLKLRPFMPITGAGC
jgi:hypothetical protein